MQGIGTTQTERVALTFKLDDNTQKTIILTGEIVDGAGVPSASALSGTATAAPAVGAASVAPMKMMKSSAAPATLAASAAPSAAATPAAPSAAPPPPPPPPEVVISGFSNKGTFVSVLGRSTNPAEKGDATVVNQDPQTFRTRLSRGGPNKNSNRTDFLYSDKGVPSANAFMRLRYMPDAANAAQFFIFALTPTPYTNNNTLWGNQGGWGIGINRINDKKMYYNILKNNMNGIVPPNQLTPLSPLEALPVGNVPTLEAGDVFTVHISPNGVFTFFHNNKKVYNSTPEANILNKQVFGWMSVLGQENTTKEWVFSDVEIGNAPLADLEAQVTITRSQRGGRRRAGRRYRTRKNKKAGRKTRSR